MQCSAKAIRVINRSTTQKDTQGPQQTGNSMLQFSQLNSVSNQPTSNLTSWQPETEYLLWGIYRLLKDMKLKFDVTIAA